jgi:3-oxoacyl-[acyl-carrier protein] reductase
VKPFWEHSDVEWDRVIKVNLYGFFYFGRAAARHMIERHEGKILNIASISGVVGSLGRGAYGASKGAVIALTKIMAVELAKYGVNVNGIAPGPINTRLVKASLDEEAMNHYRRYIPFRRLGEPSEIADAALFLCSDNSRYITGHTLAVDGGFLAAGVLEKDW